MSKKVIPYMFLLPPPCGYGFISQLRSALRVNCGLELKTGCDIIRNEKSELMEAESMFDYQKFENDIAVAMETTLRTWAKEHDDIYILSLDCSRDMTSVGITANTKQYLSEQSGPDSEDYWYYKYCEAEWELWEAGGFTKEISSCMNQYIEENGERFTDPETSKFLEAFDEHCDKMTESCKKAIQHFKQHIHQDFPGLLLTLSIGEYLDDEERAEFFALVNGREASEEYAEHIADFN